MVSYDLMGNVVLIRFPDNVKEREKKKIAEEILRRHKKARTVLEKVERVKGRLRKQKTKVLAGYRGEDCKEVEYTENKCRFRFNADSCYFSSRLSGGRKYISEKCRKKDKILVMFSGIGVYGIVIGKLKGSSVKCVEISRECNKYAKENVKINKLDNVSLVSGDVKKIIPKLKQKFDKIMMARPNLKETFLIFFCLFPDLLNNFFRISSFPVIKNFCSFSRNLKSIFKNSFF
jgi:tRNA G37 N-methylase Trm5